MLYIAFDPVYAHPLPEGHRFPMLKYELIPEQLLYEGTIGPSSLHAPEPCPLDVVEWTHTHEYVDKLIHQTLTPKEQRHIGFPQSPDLTRRELVIAQGTINGCLHALDHGIALNVAGGTHHAFADRGEGFCLLNDFAIAAHYLLQTRRSKKILIVDLDVHQGNGTAKIFEQEERVFTFSMHGKHNYPFHKEKSDLDIELNDGARDEEYLQLLQDSIVRLSREVRPDFVFYLSGVDILETDKFGKLGISMEGCKKRDQYVFSLFKQLSIPIMVSMGGGYSPEIKTIVEAHCNTFRVAKAIYH